MRVALHAAIGNGIKHGSGSFAGGTHIYGRTENKGHPSCGFDFTHPELFQEQRSLAARRPWRAALFPPSTEASCFVRPVLLADEAFLRR